MALDVLTQAQMRKMAGEGSGDSAASGLPETTKAHQQLTTDNNGEAVWTDELAYDNSIVYRYDGTMEGKVVSASGGYVRVSEDTPSPEEMIEMRLHMSSESTGEGMRLGDWSYASTEETWHDTMAGFVDVRYKPNSEFPATGIYFATDLLEWWLSKNDIKQQDEKFIPDTIARKDENNTGALIIRVKYEDERYIPYGVNSMREILDAVEAGRNVYLKRESSDLAWSIYPLSSIDYTYEDEMFSNGFVVEFMSPGSPAKWTFTTKVSEMDYMPDASFYSGSAT